MGPLLFNTNYIAPIWSGDRINKTRGLAGNELYGEGFDVSAHRGMVTSVKGGPYDGTPLDELIRDHHEEVIGTSDDDGVTQTLMLDARETVSVQVHPNEAYAREHEDDHEKAEACTSSRQTRAPRSSPARSQMTWTPCAPPRQTTRSATSTAAAYP